VASHPPQTRGFTFVEVMLFVLVIGALAAVASVQIDYARRAGNESAAIASLRSINAAQAAFASSCGEAGFAQSLDDLGKLPPGASQAFLTPELASNGIVRNGYAFSMRADAGATIVTPTDRVCNQPKAHAMSGYFVSAIPAVPLEPGRFVGQTSFATDKRGVVYRRDDGEAISPGMYGAVPIR
jgi:type II secretory pathway pseudopilin PulG